MQTKTPIISFLGLGAGRGGRSKNEQVTGRTMLPCIEFLTETLFSAEDSIEIVSD